MLLRSSITTDYDSPQQCLAALRRINPTDTEEAGGTLSQLLEGMAVASPDPLGHLQVLEEMRTTLDFVLETISKRYASRPLPPLSGEDETFRQVVRMWNLMATNYGFVSQRASLSTDPAVVATLGEKRALIAHRRIQYHAQAMMEFFRARREMPEGIWRDLHALHIANERAGVANVRVPDSLNEVWGAQSPLEAYLTMLLVDAASPYSRTTREFTWVVRWAARFAPYCQLESHFVGEKNGFYALNTNSDHGLKPANLLAPEIHSRSLTTSKLAAHIQAVVGQLKKGVAASSLGLGDDCIQPACARLLVSLYRPWGLAAAGRKFPRRRYRGQVQLSADPNAIAFFLTGESFEQPTETSVRTLDFTRTEAMLTLGEMVSRQASENDINERALQLGYVKETWEILDQSVAGFRLVRVRGDSRVEHRQLVGLSVSDADKMLLAEISWLQYQHNGALHTGISLMPGPPQVTSVRLLINEKSTRDRYRIGFMIPGVPSLHTDPTLVVPSGWFMADRIIEVQGESVWYARMHKLVSRGTNFDRVSFSREEAPAWVESAL